MQKRPWLFTTPKNGAPKHEASHEEVRASVRFPLHLAAKVESADHNWVDAMTENISASGFLFGSQHEFPREARFGFQIQMPAAVMGTPTDVVVHGSARVVRSYKKEPMKFTAAVIDDYAFETALEPHGQFKH